MISYTELTELVQSYRLVWISGRVGVGKTSLAFKLARNFLERGYKLYTNIRSVWADDVKTMTLDDNNRLGAVFILDEGGLYIKSNSVVEMVATYPAKLDTIYLIPSFYPPAVRARVLTIRGVYSLSHIGINKQIYSVSIQGLKEKEILICSASDVWGVYDRLDPGADAGGIISRYMQVVGEYKRRYNYSDAPLSVQDTSADELEEAIDELRNAVSEMEKTSKG